MMTEWNAESESKRTLDILNALDRYYGTDVKCYLTHESAWQLLIATILSAQCTDQRVNIVTESLFRAYPSIEAFADAKQEELEEAIHSTGFYHQKAKNIIACCQKLRSEYGQEVPRTIEELTKLPGVGRKTANVIRGNIYHDPSIVVDTHVKRIARRLGWTKEKDPNKVEEDLMREIPIDHWIAVNIQLIALGRAICKAPIPKCENCFLTSLCPHFWQKTCIK
ncbi:MAG: endonuclease III [Lachnospiraceae bacterium]|nr:endonuclease III [Lachnospiraceae bacterium]